MKHVLKSLYQSLQPLYNVGLISRQDVVHGLRFCPVSVSRGSTESPEATTGTIPHSFLRPSSTTWSFDYSVFFVSNLQQHITVDDHQLELKISERATR